MGETELYVFDWCPSINTKWDHAAPRPTVTDRGRIGVDMSLFIKSHAPRSARKTLTDTINIAVFDCRLVHDRNNAFASCCVPKVPSHRVIAVFGRTVK
ncbi:MAG: hypothetical protein ACI8PT_002114 [Gammaproteobacteria bacterium]|jgi:hypothetical protein